MMGDGRKDWCGSRSKQPRVGGWDVMPLQHHSQLKVFIKLQPLFLQVIARPHFAPVCICQVPSCTPSSTPRRFMPRGQNKPVGDSHSSLEKAGTHECLKSP